MGRLQNGKGYLLYTRLQRNHHADNNGAAARVIHDWINVMNYYQVPGTVLCFDSHYYSAKARKLLDESWKKYVCSAS